MDSTEVRNGFWKLIASLLAPVALMARATAVAAGNGSVEQQMGVAEASNEGQLAIKTFEVAPGPSMNLFRSTMFPLLVAGLILELTAEPTTATKPPALDLSAFTRAEFEKAIATVGTNKLRPSVGTVLGSLPPSIPSRSGGLTDEEISGYMRTASQRFEVGEAVSVADVSLDSSLDAHVRQPMLNYVSLFTNNAVDVYLLVQKPLNQAKWNHYSIVRDKTVTPHIAYYADVLPDKIHFKGAECFACHAAGPRIIRPFRPDLLSDADQARRINDYITDQEVPPLHFPADEPRMEYGMALTMKRCVKCHSDSGDRGPLYRVHGPSIRALVEYGHMPPKGTLAPEELTQLEEWLASK
jgi:hypothetical protein